MTALQWVAALTPLLSLLLFLVVLRLPASRAMPLALACCLLMAAWQWQIPGRIVLAASIQAWVVALRIFLIVAGALLLLNLMRQAGALASIRLALLRLSPDARVQTLFIAWLFVAFIEGASGFGTPVLLAAPLLVALGFKPVLAIMLCLIGSTSPVTFGALGTPLLVGIGQGYPQADAAFLANLGVQVARHELGVATFVPLLMLWMLTLFWGERRWDWRAGLAASPLALVAGLSYSLLSYGIASSLGPEFPSLVASALSALLLWGLVRAGIAVPKASWQCQGQPSQAQLPVISAPEPEPAVVMPFYRAALPYLLLIGLLLISRWPALPLQSWLLSWHWQWLDILGTGIAADIQPLYLPGFVFLAVALLSAWLYRFTGRTAGQVLAHTGRQLWPLALALAAVLPLVRIFVYSGVNGAGLGSMPSELAQALVPVAGDYWFMLAPSIASLGAFAAGSATYSSLMLTSFQLEAAQLLALDPSSALVLQVMGANAGNMVNIATVLAACSALSLPGQAGRILWRLLPVLLFYWLLIWLQAALLLAFD